MEELKIRGERLPCGGPGAFYLCPAEAAMEAFAQSCAGQARMVYLDPPFGTGDLFSMRLGGKQRIRVPAYADTLDEARYMDMMRAALLAAQKLLCEDGSLYLHVDYRKSAQMRLLLDEVMGPGCFVNEIIWAYKSGGRSTRHFSYKHDTIYLYKKGKKHYFNIAAAGSARGPQRRNHMKRSVDADGRVSYSIRSGGKTYVYYEDSPVFPSDVWDDIEHLHQRDPERTGYSTQKPEALLRRMIAVSSEAGDLVVDLFSGSGTTAAAAAKLGRRWLAADASKLALCVLRKRMLHLGGHFSLLEEAREMTLHYEGKSEWTLPAASIRREDGRLFVEAPPEHPLQYMALGHVEAGFFMPRHYSFLTKEDAGFLHMEAGLRAPVLQAVDVYGRQCFLELG